MRIAHRCVGCDSADLMSKPGEYAPFVAHRFGGYDPDRDPFPLPTQAHACRSCGLVFAALRPDDGAMARLYNGYRGQTYNQIRCRLEPSYQAIAPLVGAHPAELENRNRSLAAFLSDYVREPLGRVLDYGGDRGQFIPPGMGAQERAVYEVSGATPGPGVRSYQTLRQCRAPYDLILCQHVLEHLPDPHSALHAMASLVRLGGLVCVVAPLERPSLRYQDDSYQSWFHEHISLFAESSLVACLEKTGDFRVMQTRTESIDYGWIEGMTVTALARSL